MKKILAAIVLIAACLTADATATAQFVARGPWARRIGYDMAVRMYFGGYGHPYGVRTPYGDYYHGMARVIQARGQAARDYSQAQINQQIARGKYLDNQKKWNDIYMARKEAAEAAKREKDARRKQAARNRRLNPPPPQARIVFLPGDRDAETGKLNWPKILQSSEFSSQRDEIQKQFDLKAHTQATPAIKNEIIKLAMAMKAKLREKVKEAPVNEYLAGRNYLDRVMHEAGR